MDKLLALVPREVYEAMVFCPVVLALVRAKLPGFTGAHAGLVNFLVVVGVVVWAERATVRPPYFESIVFVAFLAVVAWLLSDQLVYARGVKPISRSTNPVLPPPAAH